MQVKRVLANAKSAFRRPNAYVRSVVMQQKESDAARWSKTENLDPDWDERTRLIATMLPNGTSVIEFGAARLTLPTFLGPDCHYQPSDIVSRSRDTLVIDLNSKLPPMANIYDYAVLSGVLEYVKDYKGLLGWLSTFSRHIILSYATTDKLEDPITRCRNGWFNHLSECEVLKTVDICRFALIERAEWRQQVIFKCSGPLCR